jgi:hypothetical protein
LLPALLEQNILIGVATFSDSFGVNANFIAGKKLVRNFLQFHFGQSIADRVSIVAVCPNNYQENRSFEGLGLLSPMAQNKQYHLKKLSCMWGGLIASDIALVDDSIENITAARRAGHLVHYVEHGRGLRIDDMLREDNPATESCDLCLTLRSSDR